MSDLAVRLAKMKKEEREAKKLKTEKALSDRRIVEKGADALWVELRNAVKTLVEASNAALGEECVQFWGAADHNMISVRDKERELASANFNPDDATMFHSGYGARMKATVDSRDVLKWRSSAEAQRWMSSQEVAESIVTSAWKQAE